MTPTPTPAPSPAELAGRRDFFRIYEDHKDELTAAVMKVIETIPTLARIVATADKAQLEQQNAASHEQMRKALLDDDWGPLRASQEQQGALYAGMGVPFHEWIDLITAFERKLVPIVVSRHATEPDRLAATLLAMSAYMDSAVTLIGEAYLRTKERIITAQRHSIEELSTPVLLVGPRLLLVPLVGLLDTERARRLTDQLLQAVRTHRAKAVVIDITGVAAVDSKVANHIFQTVAAARLMGARSIVTGLTSDVAQALVGLGVDVDRLRTAGDLREGLEEAQHLLGQRTFGEDAVEPAA